MAPKRTFDYEFLQQLLAEHPDWSTEQYARALTARKQAEDPGAPAVKAGTLTAAISRHRAAWGRDGEPVRNRWVRYADFMPPARLVREEEKCHALLRYMRELAKEARGEEPRGESAARLRRTALNWRERLLADGRLVDLSADGVPFVRYAAASELDGEGRPLAVAAWLLPGWRGRR